MLLNLFIFVVMICCDCLSVNMGDTRNIWVTLGVVILSVILLSVCLYIYICICTWLYDHGLCEIGKLRRIYWIWFNYQYYFTLFLNLLYFPHSIKHNAMHRSPTSIPKPNILLIFKFSIIFLYLTDPRIHKKWSWPKLFIRLMCFNNSDII